MVPGKRLPWADGNTLYARAAELMVDPYCITDERYAVLMADFHAQITSCALVFVDNDHIVPLPPYHMSSKGFTVRAPNGAELSVRACWQESSDLSIETCPMAKKMTDFLLIV